MHPSVGEGVRVKEARRRGGEEERGRGAEEPRDRRDAYQSKQPGSMQHLD